MKDAHRLISTAADRGESNEGAQNFVSILDEDQNLQMPEDDLSAPLTRCSTIENTTMESRAARADAPSPQTPRESWDVSPERSPLNHAHLQTFRFLDCPDDVYKLILHFALVRDRDRTIVPYYNANSVELDEPDKEYQNIDISLLVATAGNNVLYEAALTALYGGNRFDFQEPRVMLWWLKRIGDNSVSKLRKVRLGIIQGEHQFRGYTIPDVRIEKLWYDTLVWFKPRQRLTEIFINLAPWTISRWTKDGWEEAEADEMAPKYGVYRTLLSFRGLDSAIVNPGPFVDAGAARILEEAMTLPQGGSSQEISRMEATVARK